MSLLPSYLPRYPCSICLLASLDVSQGRCKFFHHGHQGQQQDNNLLGVHDAIRSRHLAQGLCIEVQQTPLLFFHHSPTSSRLPSPVGRRTCFGMSSQAFLRSGALFLAPSLDKENSCKFHIFYTGTGPSLRRIIYLCYLATFTRTCSPPFVLAGLRHCETGMAESLLCIIVCFRFLFCPSVMPRLSMPIVRLN
jgi:hypothetical protein